MAWIVWFTLLSRLVWGVVGQGQQNGSAASEARDIPFFPEKEKITVCVSEWSPAVYCKGIQDPVDWTGFEVELFQEIMPILGWSYDMIGVF